MEIVPSSEDAFLQHRQLFLYQQADNLVQAQCLTGEQAALCAEQEWDQHLPDGMNTPGHAFYSIKQDDQHIGYIWLGFRAGQCFVYDLYIVPDYRRQGLGSQAMQWVRGQAADKGCSRVWLHVFGHNREAVAFYENQGYTATHISMRLDVE